MAYPYVSPATTMVKRPYGTKRPTSPPGQSTAPRATGGKQQAASPRGPKKIKVKAHTRTVKPKAPAIPQAPAGITDQALINAAVRSRFAPQEQAINQQLGQNARFASGTNDWYTQALGEIKGLRDQGNAAAQQTLGRITAYNSQPTLNNATDQQAAGARNNLNSEYAAMFGRDATANSDAMNRLAAAYAIQQGNTQNQTNVQRQQLLGQQGQLGQQKADYGLTYGAQLQQSQAKAQSDQAKLLLAAQALGIKTDTLNKVQIPLAQSLSTDRANKQKVARTNARTQRANAGTQRANQQETAKQHGISNAISVNKLALDSYMKAHPELSGKSPGAKFTPTQVRNNQAKFRTLSGSLKPDYVKQHPEVSIQRLVREKKVDPLLARAVVQSIAGGGVDRKTATAYYRAYGHHLRVKDLGEKVVGNAIKFLQGN